MIEYLTLVCRAALVVHAPPLDLHGVPMGSPSYRAIGWAPVQLARGYDSKGDYSIGGAWSQCGQTATFRGETLTAAVDEAVSEGWDVDAVWLGLYSRADLCPACNPRRGRRPAIQGDEEDFADSYAAA